MMKSSIRCPICKLNKWQPLYTNLLECKECGFKRAMDKYFKVEIKTIYNKEYFTQNDYIDYKKERKALEKNFIKRIGKIREYKKNGKLLEIGCAYGYFLNLAKKYFITEGFEVNPQIAQIATQNSGQKVLFGNFLNTKYKKNSYDVICMFDVIEHLKEPDKYISKIYELLKANGILAIETGDIGSFLAKKQAENWRLIKPPIHLQYFSRKTLRMLLNNNEFSIKTICNVSFNRSLAQIAHLLIKNKFIDQISKSLYNLTISTNTFDIMLVIAQKTKVNRI